MSAIMSLTRIQYLEAVPMPIKAARSRTSQYVDAYCVFHFDSTSGLRLNRPRTSLMWHLISSTDLQHSQAVALSIKIIKTGNYQEHNHSPGNLKAT